MYLGLYGGMMRGGNTDSTVVIGDGPIEAPPVVSKAWSAIAMHDEFWAPIEPKLRPDGLVLVNDATFTTEIQAPVTVIRVPATNVATDLGNPLGGSMVMLGAYAGTTGIVALDALDRSDARVDPAVPHATHRSERAGAPRGLGSPPRRTSTPPGRGARRMPEPDEHETIKSRGTVTIDVDHCKGCDLCIPACPPGVLAMSVEVNHMGYRYPELYPGAPVARRAPTCAPTSCSKCSASRSPCSRRCTS